MPRHFSRRVGAFRVRPVPDEADGRRDTESGSGVPGPKMAAVQAEGTIRGPEKGACGRSGPQGREAFEKANRTEQTGAGIPEAVRGAGAEESGGAGGRHDSQAGKQALAADRGRRAGRLPEKRTGRNRRAPGYRRRFGGAGAEKEGIRKRQTNKRLRGCACVSTIVRKPNFFVPGRSRIPSNGNKNATDRYESIVFHK